LAATALAAVSARANADARARASDVASQERTSSDEGVGRDERQKDGSSNNNSATAHFRKLTGETSPASGSAAASTDTSGSEYKPHAVRAAAKRTALAASSAADSGDASRSLSQSSSAEGDNEGGSSGYGNVASADSSVPDEDTSAEGGSPNSGGSISAVAAAAAERPAQAKRQPAGAEDHREADLNVRTSRRSTTRRRAQHAAAAASAEEETASSLDAAADGWTDNVAEKAQRASPNSPPGASSSRGLSLSCKFCHKTFSTHAHVVRHERIHTGFVRGGVY
jgi:hypothetical protein